MILDDIVKKTGERVMHLPATFSGGYEGDRRAFKSRLSKVRYRKAVIAEMKFSSPSKGLIKENPDIRALARVFEDGGASAVSVLTEPYFFGGSTDTIRMVKEETTLPILRKDFIIDERQLYETRSLGADAVLLIAGVLGDRLSSFVRQSVALGIEPLVEVRNRQEALCAVASGAEMIGINNRDLTTLRINVSKTKELSPIIRQAGRLVVSESGLVWPCDVRYLDAYADAYLIGSSIMAAHDPQKRLEGFVYA